MKLATVAIMVTCLLVSCGCNKGTEKEKPSELSTKITEYMHQTSTNPNAEFVGLLAVKYGLTPNKAKNIVHDYLMVHDSGYRSGVEIANKLGDKRAPENASGKSEDDIVATMFTYKEPESFVTTVNELSSKYGLSQTATASILIDYLTLKKVSEAESNSEQAMNYVTPASEE